MQQHNRPNRKLLTGPSGPCGLNPGPCQVQKSRPRRVRIVHLTLVPLALAIALALFAAQTPGAAAQTLDTQSQTRVRHNWPDNVGEVASQLRDARVSRPTGGLSFIFEPSKARPNDTSRPTSGKRASSHPVNQGAHRRDLVKKSRAKGPGTHPGKRPVLERPWRPRIRLYTPPPGAAPGAGE